MTDAHRAGRAKSMPGEFDPEPWRSELRGFVLRMGAGQEAEDVVQETFVRALRSPPSSRPRAWLYGVAMNVLRDHARRARSARPEADESASSALDALADRSPDPGAAAMARDTVRLAWETARVLPDRQRAALILRIQRHMDYDEIALALECSIATARQHFYLAVKKVRDALAEEHDG